MSFLTATSEHCSVCGHPASLLPNGTVQVHKVGFFALQNCAGSGKPPASTAAPAEPTNEFYTHSQAFQAYYESNEALIAAEERGEQEAIDRHRRRRDAASDYLQVVFYG